jgi:hypothetical protein
MSLMALGRDKGREKSGVGCGFPRWSKVERKRRD